MCGVTKAIVVLIFTDFLFILRGKISETFEKFFLELWTELIRNLIKYMIWLIAFPEAFK